ncbi:hypothetical protein A9P82_01200 [Arachidicoccus ginsenosidimutans]|uniref:hypothetical protein n=1 Tax=Arachidicoccus sp. BS20 TaxID=1850526 RepID=UPI0007F107B3|nr:hypothetical protein [Arachidicoccus sp. BS20]ANI88057.1 hypothetical protein A9P82_01200 [Arachidicoccus sp. BS20]
MIKEFIQKRGFNYRKFFLYSDKIIVETKSVRKINKYEAKLDRIGFNIHYQADNVMAGKIFLWVCIALPMILTVAELWEHNIDVRTLIIFYVIFLILILTNFLKQHQDDIYLTGGQINLVFYRAIPNEQEVLNFISQIVRVSKEYLKEKYTQFDDFTKEEIFMNQLRWLLDRDVITNEEYNNIVENFKIKRLL